MQYVIAVTPVGPMRAEPSHRAEMVSQLLFGETAELLEQGKDFSKIRTTFDQYEGWVQSSQLTIVPADFFNFPVKGFCTGSEQILINDRPATVYAGTPVWQVNAFGELPVDYGSIYCRQQLAFSEEWLNKLVLPYMNASYLWGGRSTAGVDCSGFVQQVYKFFDIKLPRDTYMQAETGTMVDFLGESILGDLAFFDNEDGRIMHVGILLDKENILHASGKVRIDKIDAQGIVNNESGRRTHSLRIIKRVIQKFGC